MKLAPNWKRHLRLTLDIKPLQPNSSSQKSHCLRQTAALKGLQNIFGWKICEPMYANFAPSGSPLPIKLSLVPIKCFYFDLWLMITCGS
jgi:hypothetical protein